MKGVTSRGKRILAVTDKATVDRIFAGAPNYAKCNIEIILNSTLALARLMHERFDLLLVDLVIPGLEGEELIKKARMLMPGMVVIVITAYTTFESVAAAVNSNTRNHAPALPHMSLGLSLLSGMNGEQIQSKEN